MFEDELITQTILSNHWAIALVKNHLVSVMHKS